MTTSELQRLRDRCAMLERQLLRAGVAPASLPDLPDPDGETDALLVLVSTKYSVLAPPAGAVARARFEEEFASALYYLAHARRRAEPDTSAMTSYWISGAERFLSARGWPSTVTVRPFAAAAIVSGVAYAPLKNFPHDLAWGLTLGEEQRPSARWRETLAAGRVPEPVEVKQPRAERAAPVSIHGGDRAVGRISNYYDLDEA